MSGCFLCLRKKNVYNFQSPYAPTSNGTYRTSNTNLSYPSNDISELPSKNGDISYGNGHNLKSSAVTTSPVSRQEVKIDDIHDEEVCNSIEEHSSNDFDSQEHQDSGQKEDVYTTVNKLNTSEIHALPPPPPSPPLDDRESTCSNDEVPVVPDVGERHMEDPGQDEQDGHMSFEEQENQKNQRHSSQVNSDDLQEQEVTQHSHVTVTHAGFKGEIRPPSYDVTATHEPVPDDIVHMY